MSYIDQLHRQGFTAEACALERYEELLGNSDRTGEEEAELRRLEAEVPTIMKCV